MKVPNPPPKPLVIFDGDCSFCRTWVVRWRKVVGEQVAYEPYQTAAARFPTLPRSRFRQAVQLLLPDGEVYEGAEAVFRTLALAPGSARHQFWLRLYREVPGARPLCEWGYRWIANHRPALARVTHFFFGKPHGADPEAPLGMADEPTPVERLAARRRRVTVAIGSSLAAVLLVGSWSAWRARSRRRSARSA
jgi:predicted DCC family thiol-disulfide oxidoreductase YuxK